MAIPRSKQLTIEMATPAFLQFRRKSTKSSASMILAFFGVHRVRGVVPTYGKPICHYEMGNAPGRTWQPRRLHKAIGPKSLGYGMLFSSYLLFYTSVSQTHNLLTSFSPFVFASWPARRDPTTDFGLPSFCSYLLRPKRYGSYAGTGLLSQKTENQGHSTAVSFGRHGRRSLQRWWKQCWPIASRVSSSKSIRVANQLLYITPLTSTSRTTMQVTATRRILNVGW